MANLHHLSKCTNMTKEKFLECLERIDMKTFMDNPTQAFINAGINLKKGVTFKFVESEEEANALPANIFPLKRTEKNIEALSMENLDKVAGGKVMDIPTLGAKMTRDQAKMTVSLLSELMDQLPLNKPG